MRTTLARVAFNRGLVDRLGLARTADIQRIQMSAEVMVNWAPRVLGSMMLRPGLGLLGEIYNDMPTKMLPFIFSTTQVALIELTESVARIWINDVLLSRVAVGTTVTNGTFNTNLNGWTNESEGGGSVTWVSPGQAQFAGDGVDRGILAQTLAVALADVGQEHALRIIVINGPITFMAGTSDGDTSYIARTSLDTGTHSLAFIPLGQSVFIRFESYLQYTVNIDSCTIEAAGVVTLPTNWMPGDLQNIRIDQSADIIFVACYGQQQQKIERRGIGHSWSVCNYHADDGPFEIENVTPLTMTPGALVGNTTLTASNSYFQAGHLGALFSHTSVGQEVTVSISAQNEFSNTITVTGADSTRLITINITGTWSGTVTMQFSFTSATGPWSDNAASIGGIGPWTANVSTVYNDLGSNQTIYYRIGIKTGDFVSGTAVASLSCPGGSIRGIGRITSVMSSTVANVEVLTQFGGATASTIWEEGKWSGVQGYPSSVVFNEGRLTWAGSDTMDASVSNAFESYDETVTGDSGPLNEVIGSGPVDTINWILPLTRLVLGGQSAEHTCKSSALDVPLTPTNFAIKSTSTQGSAQVEAVKVDSGGIFIQRGGIRIFSLDFNLQTYDFNASHLSAIVPRIGYPGIVRIAVQRQPDTRVHFVRSDGTVVLLIFDRVENVTCFCLVQSPGAGGIIEDVVVLPSQPGAEEDQVYYVVNRTINGVTKRYPEKWATEQSCLGTNALCFLADCYQSFTFGSPQTAIAGLPWLGQSVVVWADGADVGTVIGANSGGYSTRSQTYSIDLLGNLTPNLAVAATNVVIGLPYTAQWQSAKLKDFQMPEGTTLAAKQQVDHLGLIAANMYQNGLQFGPDFNSLDDMSQIDQTDVFNPNEIVTDFDDDQYPFMGEWSHDARVCLQAAAPRPVTLLALKIPITSNME